MKKTRRKNILFIRGGILLAIFLIISFFCRAEIRNHLVDDTRYELEIKEAAERYNLDWLLVRALIFQESKFDRKALGKAGEVGLMQILPKGAVADWVREKKQPKPTTMELQDPKMNLEIGCYFLAKAMSRWEGYKLQIPLALSQYNAGASRAKQWAPEDKNSEDLSKIDIESTRKYIEGILYRYQTYKESSSEE